MRSSTPLAITLLLPTLAVAQTGGTAESGGFRTVRATDATRITVALGDSYSSGEGAGSYEDGTDVVGVNECRRSLDAWTSGTPGGDPDLGLPGLSDFEQINSPTCSGALINDLTTSNASHHPEWLNWEEPQLDNEAVATADMITLTIGGNDAYFAPALIWCAFHPSCQSTRPWGPAGPTLTEALDGQIESLRSGRLTTAYEETRSRAPQAAIFVAGYPLLVPTSFSLAACNLYAFAFSSVELASIRAAARSLNDAIECSAREAGVHFVPVADHFADHEACTCADGCDWINPPKSVNTHESFHPNLRGQKEYARAVRSYIEASGPDLPGNPDPIADACTSAAGVTLSLASSVQPSTGSVTVLAPQPSACEGSEGIAVTPGQAIELLGFGFAGSTTIDLELTYQSLAGTTVSLGSATTTAEGDLDISATIPADAPTAASALVQARGPGAGGEPRLLLAVISLVDSPAADSDGDGLPDICDNCPDDVNSDQEDGDGDGAGDLCDDCPADSEDDWDGDGICDDVDSCLDVEILLLAGETVESSRTESACSAVAAEEYEVGSTAFVSFIAGDFIELGDGFRVQPGGTFRALLGSP